MVFKFIICRDVEVVVISTLFYYDCEFGVTLYIVVYKYVIIVFDYGKI